MTNDDELHATFGARTRMILLHLSMHRAGIDLSIWRPASALQLFHVLIVLRQ